MENLRNRWVPGEATRGQEHDPQVLHPHQASYHLDTLAVHKDAQAAGMEELDNDDAKENNDDDLLRMLMSF